MKISHFIAIILFISISSLSFSKESTEKLFTGTQTEKYQNGNLKYEVQYVNGKKEGSETFW